MTNKDWYYYSTEDFKLHLKEDVPPEVVESYNKFYEKTTDEDGNEIICK